MSLASIQEPTDKGLILLAGAPGTGKSTFCHQVAIKSIASDRPVIFVTTEQSPADVTGQLQGKGMEVPMELKFVDAFSETVGLSAARRPDTMYANCADLNSLSIAIIKQQESTGPQDTLLVLKFFTRELIYERNEAISPSGLNPALSDDRMCQQAGGTDRRDSGKGRPGI